MAPQVVKAVPSLVGGIAKKVTVTFDQTMLLTSGVLDKNFYAIDGGALIETVTNDAGDPDKSFILTTSVLIAGRTYTVSCSASVRASAPPNEALNVNFSSTSFVGITSAQEYVVQNASARTHPTARKVWLFWTNPETPVVDYVKIIRRTGSWHFEESDAISTDVVWDGAPSTDMLSTDGRPKFTDVTPVSGFFYYTILVKSVANGITTFLIRESSRCFGLAGFDLGTEYYVRNYVVPKNLQTGDFEKHVRLLIGGIDIVRSHVHALSALGSWDEVPLHIVHELLSAFGSKAEGGDFDFDTSRRLLLSLFPLYKKKGSVQSVIDFARVLVEWIALIREYGIAPYSRLFGLPDTRDARRESYTVSSSVSQDGGILDPARTWSVNQWQFSRLLDGLGNWFDVASNTATSLVFEYSTAVSSVLTVTANAVVGDYAVQVNSTIGLRAGLRLQLRNSSGECQIVELTYVSPTLSTVYFWNRLRFNMPTGSTLSWSLRKPESSMIGVVASGALNQTSVSVATGSVNWPLTRWVGYIAKDSTGGLHTVTNSTATTLQFSDGYTWVNGTSIELARSFSAGNPQLVYTIESGYFPRLFDPTFDLGRKYTRFDPFFYFYASFTYGTFGPCDLGIFIESRVNGQLVPVVASRISGVSGSVVTDTSANFVVNSLVGYYVVPAYQNRAFYISSNTSTTITVGERIDNVVQLDMPYVILRSRDVFRYLRLLRRVREIVPDGTTPYVVFF